MVVFPRGTRSYNNHIFQTLPLRETGLVVRSDERTFGHQAYIQKTCRADKSVLQFEEQFFFFVVLLTFNVSRWTKARVIPVTFRTEFIVIVTMKIYLGYVGIVVTVSVLFLCRGEKGGKKLTWIRTLAFNNKIRILLRLSLQEEHFSLFAIFSWIGTYRVE
jgi:hypothetical protein